ncbi:HAD-IA family hydrolase [Aeromonas dhakensis]|uniref:HAD-IA family hydrolase n=1 Tax=Aeromonas dhakensis TaxID=196024 RepID=UPI00227A7CBD|nr:HAD-IA family hydrolase [Aeromonas dhakensis]WAF76802.1 HAD-IA family hydrolase [Aeromonas dhakensis]
MSREKIMSYSSLRQMVDGCVLFQRLDELLSQRQITHLSFDLFDTFFRRACGEPSWVFEEAARRVLANGVTLPMEAEDYRLCRIEAESRARKKSMREEVRFTEIFAHLPLSDEQKRVLMAEELQVERDMVYLDPLVQMILLREQCRGLQVIFISDMYLSEAFLRELITQKCPQLHNVRLFVSSELGLTKQSGSLFQQMLSLLKIKPEQVLHIGDNPKADVQSAQQLGLASLHFDLPDHLSEILENEKLYRVNLPSNMQHARKLAVLSMPQQLSEEEQFFYAYGAFILGPILTAFSKWVLQSAKRLKVKNILSLMREGGIFAACINRQIDFQSQQYPDIRCQTCYASRKATYLPAIDDSQLEDAVSQTLMRRNYTVRDFFNEFGIQDVRLTSFLDTPLALLDQIAIDGQDGLQLMADVFEKNIDQIKRNIQQSKLAMRDYFGRLTGNEPYLLVDLGGGGTIPSQISKAIQQQPVTSLLLYCNHRGSKNSVITPISAFIPVRTDTIKGIKKIARSPEIFEIVLVGLEGSTLGYRRTAEGRVVPRQAEVSYSTQHQQNIRSFEAGISAYQLWDQSLGIPEPDLDERLSFLRMMERLVECPVSSEVRYLGNLVHEDNFGSERSYKVINSSGLARIHSEGIETFYRKFSKNMSYGERWLAWPQGSLSRLDPDLMMDFVGLRDARYKHAQAIERLLELAQSQQATDVIVYGAGEFFECLVPELAKNSIHIRSVIDKKANFGHYQVMGYNVISLSECSIPSGTVLIIASASFVEEIRRDIFAAISSQDVTILSLN